MRTRACVLRRFSYVHDTKLFSFVKNPGANGPEIGFENPFARSDVAVEMEEPSASVANPHRSGGGFSNFRDERLATNALGVGDSEEFPKRDEIVAASSEIRTLEHMGVRHSFLRLSNEGIHFVRDGESHCRERGRIFKFPTRGIGMVDIASARPQRRPGMLVPIEKIERERKRWNPGIFTLRTFGRLHEKLAFAR